jgi:hypothetical protein
MSITYFLFFEFVLLAPRTVSNRFTAMGNLDPASSTLLHIA